MNTRRSTAFLLSFALHAAPFLLAALLARRAVDVHSRARVMAVMAAPAAAPEETVPPPRTESPGVKGSPRLEVGGFTFDIDRIARRRNALFPFITGDLAFDYLSHVLSRARAGKLSNPYAPRQSAAPPLSLAPGELQRIVDRAWSRRDRWQSFSELRTLLQRYDGNTGDVPLVLRSYLTQNILQPYWEASIPDPRVWVMLGLSSDHVDFIDFIAAYVHDHPASRASTELLFLLDKLVQGNRDTLLALLALRPEVDAGFTRSASPEAFDLLVQIQQRYRQALAARGLVTPEEIRARYDTVRLALLGAIAAGTPDGYLADDARFLAGTIEWEAGHADDAVRRWSAMRPGPENMYYRSELRLAEILREDAGRGHSLNPDAVNRVLRAENGRWLMFSFDRLKQFGYRFETY